MALMLHDKKSVAGDIQFILIDGPGKARVSAAPQVMVRAVIDRCCA
jgi:3-dehydroquinate synthase